MVPSNFYHGSWDGSRDRMRWIEFASSRADAILRRRSKVLATEVEERIRRSVPVPSSLSSRGAVRNSTSSPRSPFEKLDLDTSRCNARPLESHFCRIPGNQRIEMHPIAAPAARSSTETFALHSVRIRSYVPRRPTCIACAMAWKVLCRIVELVTPVVLVSC